jgi:hypothetical protein
MTTDRFEEELAELAARSHTPMIDVDPAQVVVIGRRVRRRRAVGGSMLAVAAVACIAAAAPFGTRGWGPAEPTTSPLVSATPSIAPTADAGPAASYSCADTPIPVAAVDEPRPASELDPDGQAALEGLEVPDIDPAEWTIASAGPTEVVLLHELPTPADTGTGEVQTHELMVISFEEEPSWTAGDYPAWVLTALTSCALTVDVPGAGSASVTLDPAAPPNPSSAEVPLLVHEKRCASGTSAEGRIEVASLRETESAVEFVITVRRAAGAVQTCPGNPMTPFSLRLAAPLGHRQLIDASVVPARAVTQPTG